MVFCVKDSQRFHLGSLCVFTEMSEGECIPLVLSRGMWKENVTNARIFGTLFSVKIFGKSSFFFTFCFSPHCRNTSLVLLGGKTVT